MGHVLRLPVVSGDFSEIAAVIADRGAVILIVDVEPCIVPWGANMADFVAGATRFRESVLVGAPAVAEIIFASNARRVRPSLAMAGRPETRMVSRAGKPWRTWYGRRHAAPCVVVGDQILTDGLLAWRLQADFVHVCVDVPAPWWPRLQTELGKPLTSLFFSASGRGR